MMPARKLAFYGMSFLDLPRNNSLKNYNAGGKQDQLLLGIFFVALGESLIVLAGAVIKYLSPEIPVVQIAFFRNFIGLLCLLPLFLAAGASRLKTQKLPLLFLRAVFGLSAMYCLFYSFQQLKLTEAVLIKATSPIMLTFIVWLVLRERLSMLGWAAIFLAFLGVVVIVNPEEFNPEIGLGFAAGVLSALLAACAKTTVRKLGHTEPSDVIVFYFMLFATLLSLPLAIKNWVAINTMQLSWMALIALLSTLGQICITKSYSVAQAGRVAMFTYLSMPIAAFLGWMLWREAITTELIIGSLIIVGAGVLVTLSSKKKQPLEEVESG